MVIRSHFVVHWIHENYSFNPSFWTDLSIILKSSLDGIGSPMTSHLLSWWSTEGGGVLITICSHIKSNFVRLETSRPRHKNPLKYYERVFYLLFVGLRMWSLWTTLCIYDNKDWSLSVPSLEWLSYRLFEWMRAVVLEGKKILERFVEHIESNSDERQRWLARVREAGFDQALFEFRQTFECCTQICNHPGIISGKQMD